MAKKRSSARSIAGYPATLFDTWILIAPTGRKGEPSGGSRPLVGFFYVDHEVGVVARIAGDARLNAAGRVVGLDVRPDAGEVPELRGSSLRAHALRPLDAGERAAVGVAAADAHRPEPPSRQGWRATIRSAGDRFATTGGWTPVACPTARMTSTSS